MVAYVMLVLLAQIYSTELTGQPLTNLTVTLQWFDKQTTVDFANTTITLLPSSIKYSASLGPYQFKSQLNRLQLVMSARLEIKGGGDSCSVVDAIVDPDLSVLIDTDNASSNPDSVCSKHSSKLSAAKIAGIVLGIVAALICIAIVVIVTRRKRIKANKFEKKLQAKIDNSKL
eukprot:gene6402-7426_t